LGCPFNPINQKPSNSSPFPAKEADLSAAPRGLVPLVFGLASTWAGSCQDILPTGGCRQNVLATSQLLTTQ